MQLDIERTKIDVVEQQTEEYQVYGLTHPARTSFVASVDGYSIEGHHIYMSRIRATPDDAIKALFEGMTDVGVTL